MTTEPTDDELAKLFTEETGFDVDDFPAAILDFARAARARWGQPSGAVDWIGASSHHLIQQPTQAVPPAGREPLTELQRQAIYDEHSYLGDSGWEVNWSDVIDAVEAAHGIKGKEAGNAE